MKSAELQRAERMARKLVKLKQTNDPVGYAAMAERIKGLPEAEQEAVIILARRIAAGRPK